jgi:UDP-N-acetylmuramate--alanine ligase
VMTNALLKETPIHLIGVGGIGMSALARLLHQAGYTVSGSDAKANGQTSALSALGMPVFTQHQAEQVPQKALVVVSTAIPDTNPELVAARQQGLTVWHRAQLLNAWLVQHPTVIGVAGTHGKTTTTGMIATALMEAGRTPSVVAGGLLPRLGTNALLGQDCVVAELDESDGSICHYQPTHVVITNVELDHADHYPGGLAQVMDTFAKFLARLNPGSTVFYHMGCPNTVQLLAQAPDYLNKIPYGLGQEATYQAVNAFAAPNYEADIHHNSEALGHLVLSVPGEHNLLNALAAVAVCDQLNVSFTAVAEGLMRFSGMGRRFERVGVVNDGLFIDDYAHHPTEVKVTLAAARQVGKHITVIFQPHRYSRLQTFWADFLTAFLEADRVVITDVYSAGEAPIPDADAPALANALHAEYLAKADWDTFAEQLRQDAQPGDVFISMGAGDITGLFRAAL